MCFQIIQKKGFNKEFEKELSLEIQKQFLTKIKQLKNKPFKGKPLGRESLRELKVKGFRLYYLLKKEQKEIILLTISNKKMQQQCINLIKKEIFK